VNFIKGRVYSCCSLFCYTLIELMVVVAIIAILVSLLLGALNVAQQVAKDKGCIANLSNIGANSFAYSGDNMGFFPRQSRDENNALTVSWDDNLSGYDGRYLSDADKYSSFLYYDADEDPDYYTLGKSYVNQDHSMYQCPMDEPPDTDQAGVNVSKAQPRRIRRTYNPNSVHTYELDKRSWGPYVPDNMTLLGLSKYDVSRTIASVEDPGGTIAFAEQLTRFNGMGVALVGWKNWSCDGVNAPAEVFCKWLNRATTGEPITKDGRGGVRMFHGKTEYTANYLFSDGHVEMLEAQDTVNPADEVWALLPYQSNGMWTAKAGD